MKSGKYYSARKQLEMIDEEEYGDSVQPFDLGHYHPENRGDDLPPSLLSHVHDPYLNTESRYPNQGRGHDYYDPNRRHTYATPKTKDVYNDRQRNTVSHSPNKSVTFSHSRLNYGG